MQTPQHIFALTKSEQRVVIVMMIALLGLAAASQYHDRSSGTSLTESKLSTPAASPGSDEPAAEDAR